MKFLIWLRKLDFCFVAQSILVIITFAATGAKAQRPIEFVASENNTAKNLFLDLRNRLANSGRADLWAAVQDLELRVDEASPLPMAYASTGTEGGKLVTISTQLILLFCYFAELNKLNQDMKGAWSDCVLSYSAYVRQTYPTIISDIIERRQARVILPPENYAEQGGGTCDGITKKYPIAVSLYPSLSQSLISALVFTFLHEIGHHINMDVSLSPSDQPFATRLSARSLLQTLCVSKSKETKADNFAATTAIDMGWGLVAVEPTIWTTLVALGTIDPNIELYSDHPNPFRREVDVLLTAKNHMDARGLPMPDDLSKIIERAKSLQGKFDTVFPVVPITEVANFHCQ